MNIKKARQVFNSYENKNMSASDWFYADADELKSRWGVPSQVIEALEVISNYEEPSEKNPEVEIGEARERISNKEHTNKDLELMVNVGLAIEVGNRTDEFGGAGIVWIDKEAGNPYSDNYEESFVTRGR